MKRTVHQLHNFKLWKWFGILKWCVQWFCITLTYAEITSQLSETSVKNEILYTTMKLHVCQGKSYITILSHIWYKMSKPKGCLHDNRSENEDKDKIENNPFRYSSSNLISSCCSTQNIYFKWKLHYSINLIWRAFNIDEKIREQ